MKKEKRINKNTQNPKRKIRLGIEILSIGILLSFGASNVGFAQNVGINQPNPDNSALLDLTSTERGLLIPRVALDDINTAAPIISPVAEGLLIYNETGSEPHGFYYWDGSQWIILFNQNTGTDTDDQNISGSGLSGNALTIGIENGSNEIVDLSSLQGWKLTGNSGTVDGTNFIGTTDNIPFNFRINNEKAGRIATDNTFYGHLSGNSITTGINNVFNGNDAGYNVTTGSENVFVGHRVGYYMQTGTSNTAVGYNALYNYGTIGWGPYDGGNGNVALGKYAMFNPISGDYNVAIGYSAFSLPNDGSDNVFIGRYSDRDVNSSISYAVALGAYSHADADYATAIGYKAYADNANTLILGQINGVNGATDDTRIGIGTTNPLKQVHIVEDDGDSEKFVIEDDGGTYSYLYTCIRNTTGSGNMSYSFSQQSGNSHFAGIDLDPDDERLIIRNNYCTTNGFDNGVISFETRNPSGQGERVRITNDGDLEIGTAIPGGMLTLGACNSSSEGGQINWHGAGTNSSWYQDIYGENMRIFTEGSSANALQVFGTTTNVNIELDGNYNTYSDTRIKTNQRDLDYGLKTIMQIEAKRYDKHNSSFVDGKLVLSKKDSENQFGFIAQDLYKIIPEIVSKPKDENSALWSVSYGKLTPILVKAIQEQQAMIERQQKQISELKELVEYLIDDKNSGN
ncbi:MAG: tail fiber domain-containing protein [Bacteroidota bacterium]|nr:tail fiber domain-containing protein [Bacteroidota bacterium]